MADKYTHGEKVLVAVDCIIFGYNEGALKLLAFKRQLEPLKGSWSLIGSFIRPSESVEEAGKRVLYEITGMDDVYMEELKSYTAVDRDPGARCISIGQFALIGLDDQKHLEIKDGVQWHTIASMPELVFDHNQMVSDALNRLRNRAQFYPIGLELLPNKFTIPQLQKLYEEIFQKKFDSRNFRKKLLSLNILIQLKEKDKTSSKKGAYLYEFDYLKYRKLKNKGFKFSLI